MMASPTPSPPPPSPPVRADVFRAVLDIDVDHLLSLDQNDLIPVLPYLVRLALNSTTKQTSQDEGFLARRKKLMKLLHPIDRANSIAPLLTKSNIKSMILPKNINVSDLTMEFERSEGIGRLRVVLAEYMKICDYLRQITQQIAAGPINRTHGGTHNQPQQEFKSELFDNPVYSDDVALCLSLLLAELPPTTVNILDMSETLLYVKHGPSMIARLVANMPDMFHEVCSSMINNGDKQDEDIVLSELKDRRTAALRLLCEMNPIQALTIRSEAIQASRLPSLTVIITLDAFVSTISKFKAFSQSNQAKTTHSTLKRKKKESVDSEAIKQQLNECYDSVIAFVSGTLLGADDKTRLWFSQYIKLAQKRIDQSHPTVLSSLRTQLLWYMQNIMLPFMTDLDSGDESYKSSVVNSNIIRASATLRMYCALRCIGTIKLNDKETSTLIKLLTCRPMVSHASVHFATIGFCTILASSSILSNQDADKRATDWLKWLVNKSKYTDTIYSSPGKSSLAELVLLVAIHFHSNQMGQIADLICETLGMKIQIKTAIAKCRSLFVQDVFTDQMVTEHSVKVPVTKNLNNNIPGFLPVHCIHQLLESRAFSKHQVPIKDWIFKQICQSTAPVHSILPQLIGAYVNSIIVATSTHGPSGTNEPITCQEMESIFKSTVYSSDDNKAMNKASEVSCVLTSQILLLYYLLLYEDVRLKKNHENIQAGRSKVVKYKQEFMADVPIFYLLQQVHDNQHKYGSILAHLLKLVTTHFPQLCLVQHWLTSDKCSPPSSNSRNCLDTEELKTMLEESFTNLPNDEIRFIKVINQILTLPTFNLWPLSYTFVSNMSKLLVDDVNLSPLCLKVSSELWWRLNLIFPRKLWVMTVNVLQVTNKRNSDGSLTKMASCLSKEYDWNDIVYDPLCILRCNPKVFRTGPILEMILYMLSAFLAASRRHLHDHLREQPSDQNDEKRNREELRLALVAAQESAALQILLESCLPKNEQEEIVYDQLFTCINNNKSSESSKQDSGSKVEAPNDHCSDNKLDRNEKVQIKMEIDDEMGQDKQQQQQQSIGTSSKVNEASTASLIEHKCYKDSVIIICNHLHQVFISDTNLARLVHFQTYSGDLLPITTTYIPSMHICLDFVPDMMAQPDLKKQVFVVELVSHLCDKYAITKSLNAAKLCFNVSFTLLQLLPSRRRSIYFIPVLPALIRMSKIFSILKEDLDIILTQLNQITMAHLASTSSRLSLVSSTTPFEGLIDMSWRDTKKLMSTMDPQEALYLTIQSCIIELDRIHSRQEEDDLKQQQQLDRQQQNINNYHHLATNNRTNINGMTL